jgi:hypothetical protein
MRSLGTTITSPRSDIRTTAATLRAPAGTRSACTIAESVRVKTAKLATNPAITPNGRALPPAALDERITGSRGRIQGERMVINPEANANTIKINIASLLFKSR